MQSVLIHHGKRPVHNFLLYAKNQQSGFEVFNGVGIVGRDDSSVESDFQFKTASITKTFVATVVLQLVEEGKIILNDPAYKYLDSLDFLHFHDFMYYKDSSRSRDIRVEHLLRHTSGIADIFTDKETRFVFRVLTHKKKAYDEKKVVDLYFKYKLHKKGLFLPGEGFHYSDMNYMLLGFIIEQVTGESLAANIRSRILDPFDLRDTYFEYYEPPRGKLQQIDTYLNRLNVTKKVNTSYEWAGGGLVSNTKDLGIFIEALFNNQLFEKNGTLDAMIDIGPSEKYGKEAGMGIFRYQVNGSKFYGHGGYFGSLMLYDPIKKISFAVHLGQANAKLDPQALVDNLMAVIAN